jgi:hypothetical protein
MNRCHAHQEHTVYKKSWLIACTFFLLMSLLSLRCASIDSVSGTGSQAGNGRITCAIYNDDGTPASGAKVHLRTHNYTADTSGATLNKNSTSRRETQTDAYGKFSIDSVDTGSYCIEVNDGKSHAVLLTCNFNERDAVVRLPNDTLKQTGSIKGKIAPAPDSSVALYIQVYGLERVGIRDTATGGFIINDIPGGTYTIRVVASSADFQPIEISNIPVAQNERADIGTIDFLHLSMWLYSKKLYFNTSPTGADVAGTVTNFPVLVRLRENNFDFSLAKRDGSDLRFSKENGISLPYEIERWDSSSHEAEVWVKVDTVFGNCSTQFINLFYGNPKAADSSNGLIVFDTTDNIVSVWHLNKSCDDATNDKHDGIASSATDTVGLIGNCKKFNGSDSIMIPGLLDSPSSITLSAWAQLDSTPPDGGSEIISIGDAALIRMDQMLNNNGTDGIIHLSNNTIFYNVNSGNFLKRTGWHLITFTVDPDAFSSTLYIDGIQVGFRNDLNKPIDYSGVGKNTYIGKHGNGKTEFNFSGRIDEVRVYRKAIASDYIKLSYMNQKADDSFISFK